MNNDRRGAQIRLAKFWMQGWVDAILSKDIARVKDELDWRAYREGYNSGRDALWLATQEAIIRYNLRGTGTSNESLMVFDAPTEQSEQPNSSSSH